MPENYTLNLEEPLQAHGGTISSLILRAPKGRDFFEAGYPWKLQQDPRSGTTTQVFDIPACRVLLSRMAQVPTSTIDQLSFPDLNEAIGVIASFLARTTPKASSLTASRSDVSGET